MDCVKPGNIFYSHAVEGKRWQFVLKWDTEEKFYYSLISSFADVMDVPSDHSMVLTNPKEPNYFHQQIPAFDIRYIEDWFKNHDYPDPTKYLIKNTSLSNYTKDDIFDCCLYKTKKWSDLVSIPENKNSDSKTPSESSSTYYAIFQATSSISEYDNISSPECSKMSSSNKHTRLAYTHKEDMAIVEYIVRNNRAFEVNGRAMWEQMEHDNICRRRTWQSMKQRYLKSISYDLRSGKHRFPFLTEDELKRLRRGNFSGFTANNRLDSERSEAPTFEQPIGSSHLNMNNVKDKASELRVIDFEVDDTVEAVPSYWFIGCQKRNVAGQY
ncbi:hypothetical protein ACI65C_013870 [Semiaphis heraclei]